jgi:hypothetical protein
MKLARFFVVAVLLIAPNAWPAVAYSFPAISVQHLFADKDCEIVPDLLGDWEAGSGDLSGIWAMQNLGAGKYRLVEKGGESSNSDRGAFDICVAHMGSHLFFDATSQRVRPDGKTAVFNEEEDFWIPLHLFGRLEVKDDKLDFLLLDDSWLQDELESGRLHLTCSQDDEGNYLLTAPSKELKQFAARFATDPKAFSYREEFEGIHSEAAKRWSSRPVLLTDPTRRVATNYSHSDSKEFSKETQVAYRARRLPGSRGFASNHRLRLEHNVPTPLGCDDASHASDQFLQISDSFVQPVPQRKVINASQTLP